MAYMNINTNELPDPDRLEPVPAGKYICEIVESDVVSLKTGNGTALNITLHVLDGDYAGRKIWDRINYEHTNELAQRIGQQTIKSICKAIGFEGHLDDSAVLHGQPLAVRVAIEDKDPKYPAKNVVKGYDSAQAAAPSPQPRQQSPSTARSTFNGGAQSPSRAPVAATATRANGAPPPFLNRR